MSIHVQCDPATQRWSAVFVDQPGRPKIECETIEQLEAMLDAIDNQIWNVPCPAAA